METPICDPLHSRQGMGLGGGFLGVKKRISHPPTVGVVKKHQSLRSMEFHAVVKDDNNG